MFTRLHDRKDELTKRLVHINKYEYRVSGSANPGGGIPGGMLVIDHQGNFRPNSIWGQTYFVDYRNGSDTNNGLNKTSAYKTLSTALSNVSSNNWDLVVIDPDSTVTETAMISFSSNRTNIIGDTSGRLYGQGAKVSVGVTTAATDIGTFQNTGVRNTIAGIKFMNSNTVTEGIYSLVEAGEFTLYKNCEAYKSTDLDQAGAADCVMNGDSSQFVNCIFGSNVNAITANGARPNVLLTREKVSGKVCRDGYFGGCKFWYKAGDTDNRFVYSGGATDVERYLEFEDCGFHNTKLAAQTMTTGIGLAAALTEGYIVLTGNTWAIGTTDFATGTGIYQACNAANAANGCEVIASA